VKLCNISVLPSFVFCLCISVVTLTGCQNSPVKTEQNATRPTAGAGSEAPIPVEPKVDAPPLTACNPEDRPQMCTREYRPVCALVDTGTRCITTPCPSTEWKTHSNACEACANKPVIGFIPEACAQQSDQKPSD